MTDGLLSVQMRMAELRSRFAMPAPAPRLTEPDTASAGSSFEAALNKATQATGSSADVSSYPNGRIPESALAPIGGGERLAPKAAQAFLAMQADATKAGVRFSVNDSYRSHDDQVTMAAKVGLYGKGGLAAVPGTSNHGKGLSVDLELNAQAQGWMRTNGAKYGFKNDVAGEPWHWTYTR